MVLAVREIFRKGRKYTYLLTGCALSVSDLGASLGRSDLDGSLTESNLGTSRRRSEFGAPELSLAFFSRSAVRLHKKKFSCIYNISTDHTYYVYFHQNLAY